MKKFKSLKVRMPLTIISIVIIFMLILIIITDTKASDSIKKTALAGYNNTVFGYASLIDTWFDEQLIIANTYGTTRELIEYLQIRNEETKNEADGILKKLKSLNKYAINIGLSDLSGSILLDSDNENLIGKNIFDLHPDVKNKINSNNDGIFGEAVMTNESTGGWHLVLLEKIRNVNSDVIGYVHIFLNWTTLNQTLIEPLVIGKTGHMFTIDNNLVCKIHSKTKNINIIAPSELKGGFDLGKGVFNYIWEGEKRVSSVITLKS